MLLLTITLNKMGFFERLKEKETPKPPEEKLLVSGFEENEELERVLSEYINLSTTMFAITHDYGIDMNTDINSSKIKENQDLKDVTEKYFKILEQMSEIEKKYGERLREYLKPYMNLENPPENPFRTSLKEWDRLRTVKALKTR